MKNISNRYAAAIRSSNLKSPDAKGYEGVVQRDADVLGSMGLADRALTEGFVVTGPDRQGYPVKPAPMAATLARLFAGDNRAAAEVAAILEGMIFAARTKRVQVSRIQAKDMAEACLAFHRNGRCRPCNGLGYALIPGTNRLSAHECPDCKGEGLILLDKQFPVEHRELARWAVAELEMASGPAFEMAAKKLAPKLDF